VTLASFPDVELMLCDLLSGIGTTGTETPQALESEVPYIRVTRTGDAGSDRITDRALVSVAVFAANATDAKAAAAQARQLLVTGLPAQTAHGLIDWAWADSGPSLLPPTDSDNLRLVVSGYTVMTRRVPQ